jgi:hypothetical protein
MSLNAPNITNKRLDPALIRREFLGLQATNLHYLDGAIAAGCVRRAASL